MIASNTNILRFATTLLILASAVPSKSGAGASKAQNPGAERGFIDEIVAFAETGASPTDAWRAAEQHPFDPTDVTGSSSSKNIPHLRAVAGLMRATASGDDATVDRILDAYAGFFGKTTDLEDGSATYTRWIWPPVVVVRGFAERYDRPEVALQADVWLDSQAAKWAIATGWGREGTGFHAGKRRGHTSWRPNAYSALARSATHNEPGGSIMWVEFCSNSAFLSLMLGEGDLADLRDDFEEPILRWVEREFGRLWERDPALRRDMLAVIDWKDPEDSGAAAALERLLPRIRYTAPEPVWIWRTTREVGVFGEVSFNNGSTDFLRSKVWTRRHGGYRILLEDYPARRNQGGGGRTRWELDEASWSWTGPIGRDRIWSLEQRDWVPAPITWSPSGRKIYLVRIGPEGAAIQALSKHASRAGEPETESPAATGAR